MGKNKTNKELWFYVAAVVVLVSIILLLITEAQFPNGLTSSGIVAIISAVLGVLLTVAVTAILLNKQGELQEKLVKEQSNLQKELINQQSEQTEEKEKQVKVFEKKQEVYHAFLDKLQEIIQDGKVKVGMNADGDIDKSVDQLKDLFFQLGYLQMHCSDDTFNTVLDEVARIIQNMHDYASTETLDKQNKIPEFYAELFMRISTIVSALKEDLYQNKGNGKIEEKRMKIESILNKCGLYVETTDFDKYVIQKYFWNELCKQLKIKGYQIEEDFNNNSITEYYDPEIEDNRYYGFNIEICTDKQGSPITFRVEIEDRYYYGFPGGKAKELLRDCIKELGNFSSNTGWCGWKYPSLKYNLDFDKLDSEGFKDVKNPLNRLTFMKGLADEIDGYIKRFLEIAKEKGLID